MMLLSPDHYWDCYWTVIKTKEWRDLVRTSQWRGSGCGWCALLAFGCCAFHLAQIQFETFCTLCYTVKMFLQTKWRGKKSLIMQKPKAVKRIEAATNKKLNIFIIHILTFKMWMPLYRFLKLTMIALCFWFCIINSLSLFPFKVMKKTKFLKPEIIFTFLWKQCMFSMN